MRAQISKVPVVNATPRWFVAEALFKATVQTGHVDTRQQTEELLFLVQAVDHPSGVRKAELIARRKEHAYENAKGQPVKWSFVRLVELTEMLDQQLEEGVELKSTISSVQTTASPSS